MRLNILFTICLFSSPVCAQPISWHIISQPISYISECFSNLCTRLGIYRKHTHYAPYTQYTQQTESTSYPSQHHIDARAYQVAITLLGYHEVKKRPGLESQQWATYQAVNRMCKNPSPQEAETIKKIQEDPTIRNHIYKKLQENHNHEHKASQQQQKTAGLSYTLFPQKLPGAHVTGHSASILRRFINAHKTFS